MEFVAPNVGRYFKPDDCASALAILIRVSSYDPVGGTKYMSNERIPEGVFDAWVFRSQDDIDNGTPEQLEQVAASQKGLISGFPGSEGRWFVPVRLGKGQAKNGKNPPWVWVPLSQDDPNVEKLSAFADKAEAALSAECPF